MSEENSTTEESQVLEADTNAGNSNKKSRKAGSREATVSDDLQGVFKNKC